MSKQLPRLGCQSQIIEMIQNLDRASQRDWRLGLIKEKWALAIRMVDHQDCRALRVCRSSLKRRIEPANQLGRIVKIPVSIRCPRYWCVQKYINPRCPVQIKRWVPPPRGDDASDGGPFPGAS